FLTAIVARLVKCVPEEKSGQAFALFSVITLLPYAVIPPLIQPVSIMLGGFPRALDLTGLLLILIVPLCGLLPTEPPLSAEEEKGLGLREAIENLKSFKVMRALLLTLLVWTAFAPLFFFLDGFGKTRGIVHTGLFFTLSTFSEIGVRLGVGRYLDRMDKTKMLGLACVWLTVCYVLLAHAAAAPLIFFGMGVCFGLGWGVAMPLLSGIVFDVSQNHFRSLNTNLGMQMSQAGFFFGPSLGGLVLVHWGYEPLFYGCASLTAAALLITLIPDRRMALRSDRHLAPLKRH
ncbi:MAG: MFS transporter, partial [Desulfomonilaceae bacterium]